MRGGQVVARLERACRVQEFTQGVDAHSEQDQQHRTPRGQAGGEADQGQPGQEGPARTAPGACGGSVAVDVPARPDLKDDHHDGVDRDTGSDEPAGRVGVSDDPQGQGEDQDGAVHRHDAVQCGDHHVAVVLQRRPASGTGSGRNRRQGRKTGHDESRCQKAQGVAQDQAQIRGMRIQLHDQRGRQGADAGGQVHGRAQIGAEPGGSLTGQAPHNGPAGRLAGRTGEFGQADHRREQPEGVDERQHRHGDGLRGQGQHVDLTRPATIGDPPDRDPGQQSHQGAQAHVQADLGHRQSDGAGEEHRRTEREHTTAEHIDEAGGRQRAPRTTLKQNAMRNEPGRLVSPAFVGRFLGHTIRRICHRHSPNARSPSPATRGQRTRLLQADTATDERVREGEDIQGKASGLGEESHEDREQPPQQTAFTLMRTSPRTGRNQHGYPQPAASDTRATHIRSGSDAQLGQQHSETAAFARC